MRKRIVYTAHNGGVSICQPSGTIISWLGCGGMWNGYAPGTMDRQIESMIKRGVRPDAARRYALGVTRGGCTTAEAFEIIRDRDCGHLGTAFELWDVSEVPTDRWFRDAWRRSHNGGPIGINLGLAKKIQFKRIRLAFDEMIKKQREDLDCQAVTDVDWVKVKNSIHNARDELELRTIWPNGLEKEQRNLHPR